MFTGIIEEIGRIRGIHRGEQSARLTVAARKVLEDIRVGDSIAVSGACLTVTDSDAGSFGADLSFETLRATTLGDLGPGDPVNLERAMAAGGRFGGHMVTGHVDGVGMLRRKEQRGNAWVLMVSAPDSVLENVIVKGSIAVEGISLTVNEVGEDFFTVSIIPHTAAATTLGQKGVGSRLNLESDMIGKYVRRILGRDRPAADGGAGRIDTAFLSEHGFL